MAIDLRKEYHIKNASGMETDVNGEVLIQLALADEKIEVEGKPIREFVSANADREDTIRRAHDQGVPLVPPAPRSESDEVLKIRELEAELVAAVAIAEPEREDRDVGAFAPPVNKFEQDGSAADATFAQEVEVAERKARAEAEGKRRARQSEPKQGE